ncbi:hypothetical protein [Cellulosimicrobium sp. TH-20]|uniref:hypothetical protein n=1 Tax=Cellulosimicrobium sp. TH-20 TaxID=1980001 RepID=UPI001B756E05
MAFVTLSASRHDDPTGSPSSTARPGTRTGRRGARRRAVALAATLTLATALAACTGGDPDPAASTAAPAVEADGARAAAPEGVVTLAEEDPAALALAASRTFFTTAPVAVVVPADVAEDAVAVGVAGALAERVVAPVLVAGDDAALADELARLDAAAAVVVAPEGTSVPGLGDVTAVHVDPAAVAPDGAVDEESLAGAADLAVQDVPATGTAETSTGVLALTDPATGSAARPAAATARASGATVVDAPGGDPRTTSEAVQAVAAAGATATVGLGASFGSPDDLAWRVEAAATGTELPGGGQLALPGKRYVALYGSPGAPVLGVLGEQDVAATIARAQEHAAWYQGFTDEPVVPTLEIITTVASGSAGSDGNYSNERAADLARPYVDAAREAGVYVVLDFQPGRTDFLTQVRAYEDLVAQPHVGVALDPEWRLGPDQVHLAQIGSVGVDEVNAVGDYLAGLVRERDLPQKVFLLHQFRTSMITDRARLDTAHPELATVVHADGQGGQEAKAATWSTLHRDAPAGLFWGWKNFYDEDAPMLTPEQTWGISPTPDFVSYQ